MKSTISLHHFGTAGTSGMLDARHDAQKTGINAVNMSPTSRQFFGRCWLGMVTHGIKISSRRNEYNPFYPEKIT